MKKLVRVEEVEGEGLIGLMGEQVLVFCLNYIYTGKLVGVNTTCIKLESPKIVYDTGSFSNKTFTTAEVLPNELYIQTGTIESFHKTNKV
jgi:hypothetical protein